LPFQGVPFTAANPPLSHLSDPSSQVPAPSSHNHLPFALFAWFNLCGLCEDKRAKADYGWFFHRKDAEHAKKMYQFINVSMCKFANVQMYKCTN